MKCRKDALAYRVYIIFEQWPERKGKFWSSRIYSGRKYGSTDRKSRQTDVRGKSRGQKSRLSGLRANLQNRP